MDQPQFTNLGIGLGLRPPHYGELLQNRPPVDWLEAISENYMGIKGGAGGRPLHILEKLRQTYPIVLHGVSLSIGSTDPLDEDYLARLDQLIQRVEPAWVSDHLCWTGVAGENLHDLLPLPFTEEAMEHVVPRVERVQERLGRRMVLENVSSYLTFEHSEMQEWEFLSELARRTDCFLLLDVNNIYVSALNQGYSPADFLNGISKNRVAQIHLAGYSEQGKILIDTHDHPVSDPVWKIYAEAIQRFGAVSTLIEWDDKIPSLSRLIEEADKAKSFLREEARG
jgi:uncharacterized protein